MIESISAGSTHVLPVCTEAEPETANILDRLCCGRGRTTSQGMVAGAALMMSVADLLRRRHLRQAVGLPGVYITRICPDNVGLTCLPATPL